MRLPAAYRAFNIAFGAVAPSLVGHLACRKFLTPFAPRGSSLGVLKAARAKLMLPQGGRVYLWGTGHLVLVVPGWSSSPGDMHSFIESLLKQGYAVAALIPPGHSPGATEMTHIEAFTQSLLSAGRALGPARAVIGHSMGASAALSAASRGLLAEKIVSLAAPAALRGVLDRYIAAAGLPPRAAKCFRRGIVRASGRPEHASDIRGFGGRVNQDVLVIHDRDDDEVPFGDSLLLRAYLSNSSALQTRSKGHWHILDSGEVIEASLSFIRPGQANAFGSQFPTGLRAASARSQCS